jgi:hypothetical protein
MYLNTTTGAKWYDGAAWRVAATLDATQTFTNKTLDAAKVSTYIDYTEVAAPSNPAASTQRVYAKSDGKIYKRNSAGVETEVGASGSTSVSIPLGAIIATFPNLTGAYACVATTSADVYGFVLCNGQVISDVTSPLNGQTIPFVNNDIFIKGTTSTAGVSGGNASVTLVSANLPAHGHDMGHSHTSGTLATSLSATHNHTSSFAVVAGGTHNHGFSDGASQPLVLSGGLLTGGLYASGGNQFRYASNIANDGSHGHTLSGSLGFDGAHTHTMSGSVAAFAGNTGNGPGSSTSFSIIPSFISAKYVMRIV